MFWLGLIVSIAAGFAQTDPPDAETLDQRVARAIRAFTPIKTSPAKAAKRTSVDTQAPTARNTDASMSKLARKTALLARSIWPDGRLPVERAGWFCRMYTRLGVSNQSLVHFVPDVTVARGGVVVRGTTNEPSLIDGLKQALHAVGVEKVRMEVRVLPDRKALGDKLFGACQASQPLTFNRSSEHTETQTQMLFGEPVFLLDLADGRFLVHAQDGYWGWVDQGAIRPMNAEEFQRYTSHRRAVVLSDIDGKSTRILRGARVPVVGSKGNNRIIMLPDGSRLPVATAKLRDLDPAPRTRMRIAAALELLGIPYVWAGRSPLGMDCSGLIQNVSARAGEAVARDSWQQALAGTLVATAWHRDGLRAGDIVFFIKPTGRIYHVGIAINATHILHAAPPAVQIGSIKQGDRLYSARLDRDFFMAKRP